MLCESYAVSQRSFSLARSIAASPAGFIRPLLMSAKALVRLILDQMLFGRRGVNLCSHDSSSKAFFFPSIHP